MKIGTITTHMADNYGAVLQAYALSNYIDSLYPCEIINYYPDYAKSSYSLKAKIRSPQSLIYWIFDSIHIGERKKRKESFAQFREKYLKLSQECHNYDELRELSSEYQAVIAGSDQIWNPQLHKFDENYFLTFCQDSVKKYGYAPSFGVSKLKTKEQKIIKVRCEGFSDLAFRENSGVEIAKELFGDEFRLVLDPVFLLNKKDWEKLMADIAPKKPYYLCFYLSNPRDSVKHVCRLGKKNGVDVISIGYSIMDCFNSAKKIYDLGPLEFLSYIYNAECIFTDSFHATAFSLIFNRPFYTRVDGKNAKRSDRVMSLISTLELSDRAYSETGLSGVNTDEIDYRKTNELMSEYVKRSQDYIHDILENRYSDFRIKKTILQNLKAYSGYALDKSILQASSSGGFATAMGNYILRNNGIVYGVGYTDDFRGVEYIRVDNLEKLPSITGSKYVKSRGINKQLIQQIKTDLLHKKNVLFIGLPCEVAALKNILSKYDECDTTQLICVDLICHGPTYPKVQEEFIAELEKKYNGYVVGYSVRYKNPNWIPSYVKAVFDNGKEYVRELGCTQFGEAFLKMPMKGCFNCKCKGKKHVADVTIGDYWGIPKQSESYNKMGVSVAFVRNLKGDSFIRSLDNICLFPANVEFAVEHNLNYAFAVDKNKDYDKFFDDFNKYGLHGACIRNMSTKNKLLLKTPQFIISLLKAIRGKIK